MWAGIQTSFNVLGLLTESDATLKLCLENLTLKILWNGETLLTVTCVTRETRRSMSKRLAAVGKQEKRKRGWGRAQRGPPSASTICGEH